MGRPDHEWVVPKCFIWWFKGVVDSNNLSFLDFVDCLEMQARGVLFSLFSFLALCFACLVYFPCTRVMPLFLLGTFLIYLLLFVYLKKKDYLTGMFFRSWKRLVKSHCNLFIAKG